MDLILVEPCVSVNNFPIVEKVNLKQKSDFFGCHCYLDLPPEITFVEGITRTL